MESKLYSVEEVKSLIDEGHLLALAGDEKVLSKLPKGNWIAGTIPYFMDIDKALFTQNQVYVNKLADSSDNFVIKSFDENDIKTILDDSFDNGFSFVILPAFQNVHSAYALDMPDVKELYNNPVVGWVSGIELNSTDTPKVYNGQTGEEFESKAIIAHVELPKNKIAQLDIVNIFNQDENSPDIQFFIDSFEVVNCLINGQEKNLAEYITENNLDTKLPLVADYSGASINVSIKEVDVENEMVSFFAPIFANKVYKFAKPINDYVNEFEINVKQLETKNEFSCNCVLNYFYGELEGKKINNVQGPITFGEIAYQLLNQTLVTLNIYEI